MGDLTSSGWKYYIGRGGLKVTKLCQTCLRLGQNNLAAYLLAASEITSLYLATNMYLQYSSSERQSHRGLGLELFQAIHVLYC